MFLERFWNSLRSKMYSPSGVIRWHFYRIKSLKNGLKPNGMCFRNVSGTFSYQNVLKKLPSDFEQNIF